MLISFAQLLLAVILVLAVANMYLVFKLKDVDPFAKWNPNSINPALFLLLYVVGVIGAVVGTINWWDEMIFFHNPASAHGVQIDRMMLTTTWISIVVVLLTCTLLFYYAWKYRAREGHTALFYPHNNRLELLWTVIPAIVLALLVFDGTRVWHGIMRDTPEDAIEIEIVGKQFDWTIRYPGADNSFGYTHVSLINEGKANVLGFDFEDSSSHDDIVTTELVLPVNVPVNIIIKSRDVLHSMTLAHFRVKMDAVPGMPTNFLFTPTVTTDEMRERTGNPDFVYELSCQQICGASHYNMRREVRVVPENEYYIWVANQKPYYATYLELNGGDDAQAAAPEAEEENRDGGEALSMLQ